ncbi:MAG: aldehyde dehydrogenase family protein [Mycobacterium sp.]
MSIDATRSPAGPTSEQSSERGHFTSIPDMNAIYESQLRSHLKDGPPDLALRKDRLDRLAMVLAENTDDILSAISADFGNRPATLALGAEVLLQLEEIRSTKRDLHRWMRHRRPQPWWFRALGIDAWVEPTPLGVVGVISPWNFPLGLSVQPTAAAIAAGNRVMVKTSEHTPRTAAAMQAAFARRFSPDEIAVIIGDSELGAAFTALPLDHIFFTGSSAVGKQVQRAAAENLTPVTLELGGKNPAVVAPDADLHHAVPRIIKARLANSGQICLSPDYVLVPRVVEEEFVALAADAARSVLPALASNGDVCTIVNDKHYLRLVAQIDDARVRGATVRQVLPDGEVEPSPAARRIPLTLITSVTTDMAVMQDEIFGPVLPVIPYDTVEQVIDFVNDRPSPLGSYWFGPDSREFRTFVRRTRSGGVTRNDFALHATVAGLPFGGVGHSGTGYYHGQYGFDTFSHLRAVAVSPHAYSPTTLLSPPYSPTIERALRVVTRMWGRAISPRGRRTSS